MKFLTSILVVLCFASSAFGNNKTYADIEKTLTDLANNNPNTVSLFTLGWSNFGVPIKGIRVGNGPIEDLLVGTHHGNEYGATEVSEAFAIDMAANPIPGHSVYIIPVLNTNGYDRRSRRESIGNTTVDPNRDYPSPCAFDEPFQLNSTKALADLIDQTNITTSATIHTFYPGVLYPWGISTKDLDTGYSDIFESLGLSATFMSGYKVGNSTVELYPADGTFEDYAFWKHGIWSLLFEIGHSHNPNDKAVKEMIRVNVPGVRKMFVDAAPLARAPQHDFTGECNGMAQIMDMHNE